ncbi:MAG: type II toxin-antitoxin system HicA family toxin [Desulfovibrionaceae bacterium]|nr:type II toxin-antitoxin system HicA family toxin [Desulfovibrionaceae bacterium]
MNNKHRKTLQAVFAYPMSGMIEWSTIEALLVAAGARAIEGRGSRVRFVCGKAVMTFHRPHPEKDAKPYQVRDARAFLEAIGVVP